MSDQKLPEAEKPLAPESILKKKKKMSIAVEMGYDCGICGVETLVFDGKAPKTCLNCHAPGPVLAWHDVVYNTTLVHSIKIPS